MGVGYGQAPHFWQRCHRGQTGRRPGRVFNPLTAVLPKAMAVFEGLLRVPALVAKGRQRGAT